MDQPLEDFVRTLKAGDGGEISVFASISLVRQLLFELQDSQSTSRGNVIVRYGLRNS